MSVALQTVPFGTAYAVWTGIGAAGSVMAGMILFKEPTDIIRILCLLLIVTGIIGIKLATPDH